MEIADDDIQLEARVSELIERGLERYGTGDMEGALSLWKHAIALDPESERAANYLHYVEDHHDLGADNEERHSESTIELAYPFGVAELGLAKLRDEDLDDYESFEIVADSEGSAGDGDITKTVRIKAIAESVDDGWSVDEAWVEDLVNKSDAAFTPAPIEPLIREPETDASSLESRSKTRSDRAPTLESDFADLELDSSGDEDLEPTRASHGQSLVDAEIDLIGGPSVGDEALTMALRSPSQGLRNDPIEFGDDLAGNAALREERTSPGGGPQSGGANLGSDAMAAIHAGRRTGFGSREESTAERSGARAHEFDELELDVLEPTNLRPEIPDAIDDQTDAGVSIRFDDDEPPENVMDEELTIDRGSLSAAGLLAGARAPTQDSGLLDISLSANEVVDQLQDETRELALPEIVNLVDADGVPSLEASDDSSGGIDIGLSIDELAALDIGSSPTGATTGDILAQVTALAPRGDVGERTQFIVGRLIEIAGDEFTEGDNAKAAIATSYALDQADDSALAQKIIFENERRIIQVLIASLGELDQIPRLLIPLTEIPFDQIDHRAAFLLTRLDGTMTLDEILDVSGMSRMEALRHLHRLQVKNFVEVS